MKVGDRVVMVDRYAARYQCSCRPPEPSWFNGMHGVITKVKSPMVMVHLDGERLPMAFDERDFDVEETPDPHVTAGDE